MSKYFTAEVNREMCAEYSLLANQSYSSGGDKRGYHARARMEEIRQHLAFEVISAYCHDHGSEESE